MTISGWSRKVEHNYILYVNNHLLNRGFICADPDAGCPIMSLLKTKN